MAVALRLACAPLSTVYGVVNSKTSGGFGRAEGPATDETDAQASSTAVPAPRWAPVPRRRLYALLDEGTRGPVTLLAASAGYGKTLLLTSWAQAGRTPGPVAWMTAGPDDHQPASFWAHVLGALDAAGVLPAGGPPGDPGPRRRPAARCCAGWPVGWPSSRDRWCWSSTTCTRPAAWRSRPSCGCCSATPRPSCAWWWRPGPTRRWSCTGCGWPASWASSARPTWPSPAPRPRPCSATTG